MYENQGLPTLLTFKISQDLLNHSYKKFTPRRQRSTSPTLVLPTVYNLWTPTGESPPNKSFFTQLRLLVLSISVYFLKIGQYMHVEVLILVCSFLCFSIWVSVNCDLKGDLILVRWISGWKAWKHFCACCLLHGYSIEFFHISIEFFLVSDNDFKMPSSENLISSVVL